jgi:hypothetical protein
MIIANPLYDVIFKYLMEDIDIAKEIISTILGERIVSLEVKPQETVTEVFPDGIHVLRFDFKATIELPSGELQKVLIELQKLKQAFEIIRFRRYLGDNYSKEDDIPSGDGTIIKMSLPIVTIYILGFTLSKLTNAVVKVNREYKDMLTGKIIPNIKEDFIELLTHDSYVIQVKELPSEIKTKLERVLQVFNPKFKTKDRHVLDFTGDTEDPLVQKMLIRLQRAVADQEMRHIMNVEDEIERAFERQAKKNAAENAEKDKIIAETSQALVETKQELTETKQAVAEKDQALAEKDQVLAEKDQVLAEKDQVLAEKDQVLAEKDQVLAEKDQQLEILMRQLAELKEQTKK